MSVRFITAVLVALALALPARAQEKKYDVRSGIITYETLTLEGRIHIAGRVVLYWDDFGRRECKDTYVNGMLKESVLCDGMTVYTLWHDQRIVFRRGPATRGTESRFDGESIPFGVRGDGQIRKLPTMMVAGRICDAYERITAAGTTRYAGTDHILMYCERNLEGENWVMKAVSVDESSSVPSSKFAPPPGYVERESHF